MMHTAVNTDQVPLGHKLCKNTAQASSINLGSEKVSPLLHREGRYIPRIRSHELRPGKCLLLTQLLGVNSLSAGAGIGEHL